MNRDEAHEAFALLAATFGLPKRARLEIGTPQTGTRAIAQAFADVTAMRVVFSRRLPEDEYEWSLLHEVAHLVAWLERGRVMRGSRQDHHGPHFIDALRRVAEAWYGDAARYPWHSEYPSIRRRVGA